MIRIPACFLFVLSLSTLSAQQHKGSVQILFTPNHPANSFIPADVLGGAFDGHSKGDIDAMLTPENITAMHTVGLTPVSYRLRTELGGEVWHWNPKGTWSEAEKQQGYWVSDARSEDPIELSYGYKLPRRGNTVDQANDNGYSRIDDGDENTFWKSNPYLDEHFTNESNTLHPQWAIVDLGGLYDVNAIRIKWGNPYAVSFTAEYALDIGSDYFEPFQPNLWHSFSNKTIDNTHGENKIIQVSDKLVKARFVRISMSRSSFKGTEHADIRDKLGFAIIEMQAGLLDDNGIFHDRIHHALDHNKQSKMYVSSTDPWHRSADIDYETEQAGIDRFYTCGLTHNLPALIPSGLLYDTPENSLALFRYIQSKHYPLQEIEMGEEPEGQLISPVDYGALYYQWGKQIKKLLPAIRMGGPGFATLAFTPDDDENFSEAKWTSVFLDYLKKHESIGLFNFFSFEWYPFDDLCQPPAPQLAIAPEKLEIALKNIQHNILPENTPMYMTEYGYSAYEGRSEVEIEGGLMYADILGKFLTMGGNKSFLYGYEPIFSRQIPADLEIICCLAWVRTGRSPTERQPIT